MENLTQSVRTAHFTIHVYTPEGVDFYSHTLRTYNGESIRTNDTQNSEDGAEVLQVSAPVQLPEDAQITVVVESINGYPKVTVDGAVSKKEVAITKTTACFTVNFGRNVGLHWVRAVKGSLFIDLLVDVCPRKLSYDDDLFALREDLERTYRGLADRFSATTGAFAGNWASSKPPTDAHWLTHLQQLSGRIDVSFALISRHPAEEISSKRAVVASRYLKGQEAVALRGNHKALAVIFGEHAAQREGTLAIARRDRTFDTVANRWLLTELLRTRLNLLRVSQQFTDSGKVVPKELLALRAQFEKYLESNIFAGIRSMSGVKVPLNVISRRRGYSDLFHCFRELNLGFTVETGSALLGTKPIDQLYEYWCYFKVVFIICELLDMSVLPSELLSITPDGLDLRLRKGSQASAQMSQGDGTVIRVSYNREFRGSTGAQRPDIVVEIKKGDLSPIILILDAKYRIDESPRFVETFGLPGPPIDAINALHRYRDAITIQSANTVASGLVRPVVRGAILFPLPLHLNDSDWTGSRLYSSLDDLGIGALPLSPSSDEMVRQWLKAVIHMSVEELAWPGPPFEPYGTLKKAQSVTAGGLDPVDGVVP